MVKTVFTNLHSQHHNVMPEPATISPVSEDERIRAAQKAALELKSEPHLERGRPTVITPNRVALLLSAFQSGLNIKRACVYAGISEDAYYKRCKADADFSDSMKLARNNLAILSGSAIVDVLKDPLNRDRGKMARWVFEKKMPEEYGQKAAPTGGPIGQQNNFYLLTNEQIANINEQPDISQSSPAELFEALEAEQSMDSGAEEGSPVAVHQTEI